MRTVRRYRDLLRNRDFALLWSGATISAVGDGMSFVALVWMRLIPPEIRGRVFAVLRTSMQSTRPIGAVAAGLLLSRGDLSIAILAIGLLFVVPGFIGTWIPALGRGPTAEPDHARTAPGSS